MQVGSCWQSDETLSMLLVYSSIGTTMPSTIMEHHRVILIYDATRGHTSSNGTQYKKLFAENVSIMIFSASHQGIETNSRV
jgi:hypothetical protein